MRIDLEFGRAKPLHYVRMFRNEPPVLYDIAALLRWVRRQDGDLVGIGCGKRYRVSVTTLGRHKGEVKMGGGWVAVGFCANEQETTLLCDQHYRKNLNA